MNRAAYGAEENGENPPDWLELLDYRHIFEESLVAHLPARKFSADRGSYVRHVCQAR